MRRDRRALRPCAGRPGAQDAAADDRAAARDTRRLLRARLIRLAIFAVAVAGIVVGWRLSPLAEIGDVEGALDWAQSWRTSPWAPAYILTAFVVGGLLAMPVTLLVAVTGILFGATVGFPLAMAGALASASVVYLVGDWLGGDLVRRLLGNRVGSISQAFGRRGILTIALVRQIPVAPFSLVNLVAGATHIRYRDFIAGTFIGLAPGFLAITLFGTTIESTLRDPSVGSVLLLAAGGAAVVLAGWGTHWAIRRLRRSRAS
ncbi:MAG: hypothetical protein GVY28_06830 [Alphaproteobacteria bacterium]|nr:hypothetical protein [Alphaproteobacteria bacterium]